ncbi:NPCBM/NEW2 domain-containing protein [Paenibacillus sp. GYB003]|uniref:NPCBM/NEW2 domain-containing protein n=1 Tax=Paenibacillus sp. GYB003 TaxID=2994392 RepID=UPI002F967240
MRNKGRMKLIGLLGCLWLVSGCGGGDREYGKLMAAADKAMESLDAETAAAQYRKITEMDREKLEYGEGRIAIAKKLLADAESLKLKLGELKSRAETAKQKLAGLDTGKATAKEVVDVYRELGRIHSELEAFPTAALFKETGDMLTKLAGDAKSGKIDPLRKEIEDHMGKLAFDKAETGTAELRVYEDGLSGVAGNTAADYSAKIKAEKAKYIELPAVYNQRNVTLLENAAGKITFLGEGVKNNRLALFYKYEGPIRFAAKTLPPAIQAVFADGKSANAEKMTLRHYPDYAVGYQYVSDTPTKTLVRLDYRFGLQPKEEFAKVDIGPAGATDTLKEVLAFPDKELSSSAKATNGGLTVEIGKVKASKNAVEIHGKLTAAADTKLKDEASLYVPAIDLRIDRAMNESLFAGVAKEFNVSFDLNGSLSADAKYAKFRIGGVQMNVDLGTGGEYKPDQELLAQQIVVPGPDTQVWERFDDWDNRFLQDASGNIYVNAIGFTSDYSWTKEAAVAFGLNGAFKRFAAQIGVAKTTVGADFGTSELKVIGDGRLLQTVSFDSSAPAAVNIDLDVSGIHTLQFAASQTRSRGDAQTLIVGDGVLSP